MMGDVERGGKSIIFSRGEMSLPSSSGHDSRQHGKGNYFYDDVMQGVFSIFFSFLFLPSL